MDILTTIRLQADQYLQEGKKVEDQLRQIVQLEQTEAKQVTVTNAELAKAAKERNALLQKEKQTLSDLQKLQKAAFNPKEIELYNSAISKTQKNIDLLKGVSGGVERQNKLLGNSFAQLGGVIAAAFSVQQVIAFGNTAVSEFAKAEKAAFQLLGALNGNGEAQQRLLNLADEFQARFGIDNDVIVAQEAFLALQGRTETQIRKTIQAAIQLTAAVGGTLEENVAKLDATFEGVTARLGKLDSSIGGLTKTQLANGAAVDIINEKYQGFAEKGLEGVAGQLQRIEVETKEATERLGESLAPIKIFFEEAKRDVLNFFTTVVDGIKSFFGLATGNDELSKFRNEQLALALKAFEDFNQEKLQRLLDADKRELESAKNLSAQQRIILETEIQALQQLLVLRKQDLDAAQKANQLSGDEVNKLRDARIKELDERQKANEQLRKFTFDELNKNAELQAANRKLVASQTIQDEQELQDEILRIDEETIREKIQNAKDTLQSTEQLEIQLTEIHIKQNESNKKSDLEIADVREAIFKQQIEQADELGDRLDKLAEEDKKRVEENRDATIQAFQDIANEINALLQAQTSHRIEQINEQKDARLDAIDEEIEKLEEQHERGRIGEAAFEKQKEILLAKRAASEKKYNDQVKAEKRKQAEIDKQLAIFNIILNTARAVIAALATVPPNPFLAALASATGAVQLGVAASTPIPAFKKGTRGKHGSGLARVGEAGEEIVWLPNKAKVLPNNRTEQYGQYLDAMFEGRLNDFINQRHVEPARRTWEASSVNINFNDRNMVRELRNLNSKNSVRIENLSELVGMFEQSNPRRVI